MTAQDIRVLTLLEVAARIVANGYEAQYEAVDEIDDMLRETTAPAGFGLAEPPVDKMAASSLDDYCAQWASMLRCQAAAYRAGIHVREQREGQS